MKPHQIIVRSLETNPEDWRADEHSLESRKLKISIWIGNGALFCREEKGKLVWGFIGGLIVWNSYKKWGVSVMQERMYQQAIESLEGS